MTREELLAAAVTSLFDLQYGEDLASEQFKSMPPAEQVQIVERAKYRTTEQATKLLDAIEARDARRLEATLHTGNKTSREIFRLATGVKLPATEQATRDTIREFVGPAQYDAQKAERAAQQEREAAEYAAKNLKAERDAALSKLIRYHTGGPGTQVVGTKREWIEHLASKAIRTEPGKRGFRNTLLVYDTNTSYSTLETKHEIAYFHEVRAKLLEV